MLFTLPIFALFGSANAVISILYPTSTTTWLKNNTVAMNWTTTQPDIDTYFFRTFLSNTDTAVFGVNQSIADQTNATANYVRVLLPQVPSGNGYVLYFVNTTNPSQVFATSNPFSVADGSPSTSTIPPTTQTGSSSSSQGNIPNAQTSSANPFATSKAAGQSRYVTPGVGYAQTIGLVAGLLLGFKMIL